MHRKPATEKNLPLKVDVKSAKRELSPAEAFLIFRPYAGVLRLPALCGFEASSVDPSTVSR